MKGADPWVETWTDFHRTQRREAIRRYKAAFTQHQRALARELALHNGKLLRMYLK